MFTERVLLRDGFLLELAFAAPGAFDLKLSRGGRVTVRYWSSPSGARRKLPGREAAYDLRSVEQLRYDFERDVEDALRQG